MNYVVALLGLIGIGVLWHVERRNEEPVIATDAQQEQGGVQ
jgi:hypothetical protein